MLLLLAWGKIITSLKCLNCCPSPLLNMQGFQINDKTELCYTNLSKCKITNIYNNNFRFYEMISHWLWQICQ